MAYAFHDTNINEQDVPQYNVYRYIKHQNPYTYNYLLRHEAECSDSIKICGLEDDNDFGGLVKSALNTFKFQYKIDYNIIAFNKFIADRIDGVVGDCDPIIQIARVNNNLSQEACEEMNDIDINLILDFFNAYVQCGELCTVNFFDFYIGNLSNIIIDKKFRKLKFDSGIYTYSYQKNMILPEEKYVTYNNSRFIDNVSVNCVFSMRDQVNVDISIHTVDIEVIYDENVTLGDLDLISC